MSTKFRDVIGSYAWVILLLLCGLLAYAVIWERGYYADDYYFAQVDFEQIVESATQFRPLHHFIIYYNFQVPEAIGRFIMSSLALWVGFSVGRFAYRLTGSHVAMVFAAGMVAFPIFSTETVLWRTLVGYLCGTLLMVYGLHFFLDVCITSRLRWLKALGVVLCFFAAFLTTEQTINALILFPIIAVVGLRQSENPQRGRVVSYMFGTGIAIVGLSALVAFLLYVQGDWLDDSRGGTTVEPLALVDRAVEWLGLMQNITINSYGLAGLNLGVILGTEALLSSGLAMVLLILATIVGVLVVAFYPIKPKAEHHKPWVTILLLLSLFVTFFASTWIPAILVAGQGMAFRLLYVPFLFLSLFVSVLLAQLAYVLPHPLMKRATMAVAVVALIGASVMILGHADLFQQANQRDRQQLAAVERAIPAEYLPDQAITMVAYRAYSDVLDFPHPWGRSRFTTAIQRTWSATFAFQDMYDRTNIGTRHEVINPSHISIVSVENDIYMLRFRGNNSPIRHDQVMLYAYDETGRILVYTRLVLQDDNDNSVQISLPMGEMIVAQGVLNGGTLRLE